MYFNDVAFRVLNWNRRPLGYVDVANLKEKWESGEAKPVRSLPPPPPPHLQISNPSRTGRQCTPICDSFQTKFRSSLHNYNPPHTAF